MTWVFCDESLHLSITIPNVTICVGSLRPWAAKLGQTLIITKQNANRTVFFDLQLGKCTITTYSVHSKGEYF